MNINIFKPTVIYKKEKLNGYYAICPQIECVFTEGETLTEARVMMQDALEGIIEAMLEEERFDNIISSVVDKEENDIEEFIEINPKLQCAMSIRMAREKSGKTQEELAKKLGISPQHIKNYEKAKTMPPADKYIEIMKELES